MEQTTPTPAPAAGTTIVINQAPPRNNSIGTAGFVLALLGLVFSWIPLFNWILWILGLIFSLIGLGKRPRGLAIAGTVISLLGLALILIFILILGIALSTM